jgi:hypothetical protein
MTSFIEESENRKPAATDLQVDDASAASSGPTDDLLLPGIASWIKAFTVVGLLASVGFTAKLAHEQLLGVQLTGWSALDLSIFAGRWVIDTLTSVLNLLTIRGVYSVLFLLFALLCLAPVILIISLPPEDKTKPAAPFTALRFVTLGLTAMGLCFVILWCEIPTFALSNWLTGNLGTMLETRDNGFIGLRESRLKALFFVSKTENVASTELARLKTCAFSNSAVLPANLIVDKGQFTANQLAKNNLERIYGVSVLLCANSWLALYVLARSRRRVLEDEVFNGAYVLTAYILLPIASVFLPYMYGKLIYSAELPTAVVTGAPEGVSGLGNPPAQTVIVLEQDGTNYKVIALENDVVQISIYKQDNMKPAIYSLDVINYAISGWMRSQNAMCPIQRH